MSLQEKKSQIPFELLLKPLTLTTKMPAHKRHTHKDVFSLSSHYISHSNIEKTLMPQPQYVITDLIHQSFSTSLTALVTTMPGLQLLRSFCKGTLEIFISFEARF